MAQEASLLHELPLLAAQRDPLAVSIRDDSASFSYAELARHVQRFANALMALGIGRGERVAIYLDKRPETVMASFGARCRRGVRADQPTAQTRPSGLYPA
jgi:acyl-coenzyme A synthetase/AMP-(fatty) acid ligase